VAPALVRDVLRFEAEGFAAFAERFQARDALQGREVTLSDGSNGRADGVDATGALLVQTEGGLRVVSSAEVSVRAC
jgi:BirA family transcriptional regulator, biotin operon repressor / biotin---[acetyl-CoA-carboxylase] ligase